jgi:uncharacterized membrane protein YeaQ/YmgE (transglycosylase-associated protein family)
MIGTIVGAIVVGAITSQFGYSNANGGFAILPFLVGVVVAALLIAIYVAMAGRRDTTVHR